MTSHSQYSWLRSSLVMIMTLRESDAGTWNTEEMAEFARSFSLDALGFSVGGIMAFYPSDIPLHLRAKTLGERDLAAEMIASLAKRGIGPSRASTPAWRPAPSTPSGRNGSRRTRPTALSRCTAISSPARMAATTTIS